MPGGDRKGFKLIKNERERFHPARRLEKGEWGENGFYTEGTTGAKVRWFECG